MKRSTITAFLVAALVAAFSIPAVPQAVSLTLLEYQQGTVGSTEAYVRTYKVYTAGVFIQNDGITPIAVLFGPGEVDTATGAGGGILKALTGAWFPIKTTQVSIRTSEGQSDFRLWAWGRP